jgi:hypothetical protein
MSKSVPAWICEMYDATAYMELVWSNAQSELTALLCLGPFLNGGAIVYHRGRGTVYQGGGRELAAG